MPRRPTTTLVTEEFTTTVGQPRSRSAGRRSSSGRVTQETGPPEVNDHRRLPRRRGGRAVAQRRSTRARKAGKLSGYSSSWSPDGPAVGGAPRTRRGLGRRRLARRSPPAKAVRRRCSTPRGRTRPSRRPRDLATAQPAPRRGGRRRSAGAASSSPRTTSSGRTPRARAARGRARAACSLADGRRAGRSRRRPRTPGRAGPAGARSPAGLVDQPGAALVEVARRPAGTRVGLVGGLAVVVAVVDLLGDHGEPEQPEHLVEPPLLRADRQAGPRGVVLDDLARG